jgi:hypothetical protein
MASRYHGVFGIHQCWIRCLSRPATLAPCHVSRVSFGQRTRRSVIDGVGDCKCQSSLGELCAFQRQWEVDHGEWLGQDYGSRRAVHGVGWWCCSCSYLGILGMSGLQTSKLWRPVCYKEVRSSRAALLQRHASSIRRIPAFRSKCAALQKDSKVFCYVISFRLSKNNKISTQRPLLPFTGWSKRVSPSLSFHVLPLPLLDSNNHFAFSSYLLTDRQTAQHSAPLGTELKSLTHI